MTRPALTGPRRRPANLSGVTGHVPPASGAAATPGASATRGAVLAWGLWDWAFSAFNAVATTFVFNTYLSG